MPKKNKISLIEDDLNLLEMLTTDQAKEQGNYQVGPYWRVYSVRIIRAIKKQGLSSFRSNPLIGKGFSDAMPIEPSSVTSGGSLKADLYRLVINNYFIFKFLLSPYREYINKILIRKFYYMNLYANLKLGQWYKDFRKKNNLPNPCLENPTEVFDLCGDKIGRTYLLSYIRIYNFSFEVDFKAKTSLLEIGGGFGANIHSLINIYPNIKKVILLDISPILYISTQYLKSIYKEAVIDYSNTKNNDLISFKKDNSLEIICIAPWQIEKLDINIDLFWNSESFQEMTEDMVRNYCKNLKRIMNDEVSICTFIYDDNVENNNTLDSEKINYLVSESLTKSSNEIEEKIGVQNGKYLLW